MLQKYLEMYNDVARDLYDMGSGSQYSDRDFSDFTELHFRLRQWVKALAEIEGVQIQWSEYWGEIIY